MFLEGILLSGAPRDEPGARARDHRRVAHFFIRARPAPGRHAAPDRPTQNIGNIRKIQALESESPKGCSVPRILLLFASIPMIAAATLSLQSCGSEPVEAAPPKGPVNSLLTLPDGSTMVAAEGTLTRRIGDWLQSRKGDSAQFQFAGFHEARPRLTSAGIGRAADLTTLLRASPAATIELAGDEARAQALANFLIERGIGEERIKIMPAAGIGNITLTVHRDSAAADSAPPLDASAQQR
jgi:hypothetical protein